MSEHARPRKSPERPPTSLTPPVSSDPAEAIPELVAKHGPMLRALALRFCRNTADADDLVQDTFLQAFRKWRTFRGDSDAGTWLYTIAARASKPRLRRKGGVDRRMPALSQLMPWRETTVMELAAAPAGEEDPRERTQAVARVQAAILLLPEHLRIPLVLKEVLGVRVEDVAAALGLAPNTVKTRLHRARLWLRKAMSATAAAVPAPPPIYDKQICIDLLKVKLDAMDRTGSDNFKVPQAEVCARCRAVFRELDLVHDACAQLSEASLPASLRISILRAIARHAAATSDSPAAARRGRRPVKRSSPRPSSKPLR